MALNLEGSWDYWYGIGCVGPVDTRLATPLTFILVPPDQYLASYTDSVGRVSVYEARVFSAERGDTVSIVQSSAARPGDYFSTMCASVSGNVVSGFFCDVGGTSGRFTMERTRDTSSG